MDKIFVMCLCNRFTHQNRELLQINEKAEVSNDNKRFTKGNIEISINMRTVVRHRYSSHEWRRKRQDAAESHRASELRWGRPATPRTWTLGEPRREHGACRNRPRACPSCRFALPPASPQSSPPPPPPGTATPPPPYLHVWLVGDSACEGHHTEFLSRLHLTWPDTLKFHLRLAQNSVLKIINSRPP